MLAFRLNQRRVSFQNHVAQVNFNAYRTKPSNINNANVNRNESDFQPTLYLNNGNPEEVESQDSTHTENNTTPFSRVNMISKKGKRYQLTFRAKDPEFYFLYLHRRKSPDSSIHKSSQACSKDYFIEVRDLRSKKFVMRMKRYRITSCSQLGDTENSEQTSLTTGKPTYQGKKRVKDKQMRNEIYVEKDGMLFLITAERVEVDIAQQMYDAGPNSGDNLIGTPSEVKKGAYNSEPNRASLVARVQKDLMRVRFVLEELEIKPISVYVSKGSQCSERYAYVKFIPASWNKTAFCAVPLSTYRYRDPMLAIRRKNEARRRRGEDPDWLVQERRKRRAQAAPSVQEGQENTRSVIVFELNGHRIKLRSGHMDAEIINGGDIYDDFVIANKTESRLLLRTPNTTSEAYMQEV